MRAIDPGTSRMLSERSTIWATSPCDQDSVKTFKIQILLWSILTVLVSTLKWRIPPACYIPICLLYFGLKWLDTSTTSRKGSWWCLNSTTFRQTCTCVTIFRWSKFKVCPCAVCTFKDFFLYTDKTNRNPKTTRRKVNETTTKRDFFSFSYTFILWWLVHYTSSP